MRVRVLAAAAAALACLAGARAQQPDSQTPVIRTETRVVLVDAVVTDKKGAYIPGLTAQDFRVWEDNKEQTITSCTFEGGDPQTPDSRARYLVFLFDSMRMQPADVVRARKAAAEFVDANVGPSRLMAVASLGRGLQIVQNFTFDAHKLAEALAHVESNAAMATTWGTRGRADASLAAADRYELSNVLASLGALAKGLGGIPGRKSVVLFTPGFPVGRENLPALTAALDTCNRTDVSIYPVDLGSSTAAAGPLPGAEVGSSVMTTAPAPGTPQPEGRPRGVTQTGPDLQAGASRHVEEMLAHGTGGFVVSGGKDLFASVDKIGKEQNQYYVLGYAAPASQDGSCHSLKVKVNRHGAEVRARSAYCNVRSADTLAGTDVAKGLEARLGDPAVGSAGAFLKAPFFYTGVNTARVNLAMEIPMADASFTKDKERMTGSIHVLGAASWQDGTVAARFSDTAKLDLSQKQWEAFRQRSFHYENQFEIAPGQYTLKVVFTSDGKTFGRLETPLTIEPYDGKQLTLSALALSNDVRKAPQEMPGSAPAEDRKPLVAEGLLIIPSGSDRFRESDAAALYAEAYDPFPEGATPPDVAVQLRIMDRKSGAEKDNSGLIKISGPGLWEGDMLKIGLLLPLKKLGPGSYRLELTAYDSAGNRTAARTVGLEVE